MHMAKELERRDQGLPMTTALQCVFGRQPRGAPDRWGHSVRVTVRCDHNLVRLWKA